jgi:hypothetical protein
MLGSLAAEMGARRHAELCDLYPTTLPSSVEYRRCVPVCLCTGLCAAYDGVDRLPSLVVLLPLALEGERGPVG